MNITQYLKHRRQCLNTTEQPPKPASTEPDMQEFHANVGSIIYNALNEELRIDQAQETIVDPPSVMLDFIPG